MSDPTTPRQLVRPLLKVRQVREFTDEPLTDAEIDAILEVARWSGSSRNGQPWRFVLVRDPSTLRTLAEAGHPQTRALRTATAAIAIVLPAEPARELSDAYDDGRVAERILAAASFLGRGAAIAWVRRDARPAVGGALALPMDRYVRTIVALGEPTREARLPRAAARAARPPRAVGARPGRLTGAARRCLRGRCSAAAGTRSRGPPRTQPCPGPALRS
jgi:nitroreductase